MMQWALLALIILFLIVAYIIIQGTRAALAWRQAAEAGDAKVIRDILENALNGWRSQKRPKAMPPEIWRGIQSMQAIDAGAGYVRVSAQAEGAYKMVDGRWTETRNALEEGMTIAAKASEMMFYELGHFRPDRIQVDVYTTFRQPDAPPYQACILSVPATRDQARKVDWDEWTAEEIVDGLGAHYRLGERGQPLPIEVEPPAAPEAPAPGANGRRPEPA